MTLTLNAVCWVAMAPFAMAQGPDVDSTNFRDSSPKMLGEVVVNASYMTRESDHILALPTKEQRKHAFSGYDLLRNLMIPGVIIDRTSNTVSTPTGNATLYIDGREATAREILSLRPKDIARVEYYDIPTGKYAKDASAINFLIKKPDNGGYTQIDALQGIGFLNGDYNLVSKYISGTKSLTLWGGYTMENPKSSYSGIESFAFPSPVVRTTSYDNADNRNDNGYVQASISNRGKSMTWMIRGGIAWDKDAFTASNGYISVGTKQFTCSKKTSDRSMRPSLYFYGFNQLSPSLTLDYVVDGYYSRNHHHRSYHEYVDSYLSNVTEDYYYAKFNTNLIKTFKNNNRLALNIYEFFRKSQSDYIGTDTPHQNLTSSETIIFADYSQRSGKFFYDINPGISFMTYCLKGVETINHINPRLQLRSAYMLSKAQQLQFSFALGNTYPNISTINTVTQQIDPIIILRGNPDMDNSLLVNPRLNYNINIHKFALYAGISYFYQNHAIMSDYHIDGNHLIKSFIDDASYRKYECDISATYKPNSNLNMILSALCRKSIVNNKGINNQVTNASIYGEINYYIGDFALCASVKSAERRLMDYQVISKTPWQYQLTAMWNHGQWGAEINFNNLLCMSNISTEHLDTPEYAYYSESWNRNYNQYATLKLIYSFDYGKKATRAPEYEHIVTESAILR